MLEETKSKMSLDDLFNQIQEGNLKELNIVVKADVQGSVEAIKQSLIKLSNEEVVIKIIHGGVGAINESDVILASASNAIKRPGYRTAVPRSGNFAALVLLVQCAYNPFHLFE